MEITGKIAGQLYATSYIDNEGRELFPFTMTAQVLDRDDEIVEIKSVNLKQFNDNNQMLYQHKNYIAPIGLWFNAKILNSELLGDAFFHEDVEPETQAPISETVKRYVKNKWLKACSIGFICRTWVDLPLQDDDTVIFPDGTIFPIEKTRAAAIRQRYNKTVRLLQNIELLECSIVSIPSLPVALSKEENALQIKMVKELEKLIEENSMDIKTLKVDDIPIDWLKSNYDLISVKVGASLSAETKTKLKAMQKAVNETCKSHNDFTKKQKGLHAEMDKCMKAFGVEEPDGDEEKPKDKDDSEMTDSLNQINQTLKELKKEVAEMKKTATVMNENDLLNLIRG